MASDFKESKEVLLAVCLVGVKACAAYKAANADGKVDFNDLGAVLQLAMDPALKAAIDLAIAGSDKLGQEFKDASLVDGLKAMVEIAPKVEELVKTIEALKA